MSLFPQVPTRAFVCAIERASGPLFEAAIATISTLNPEVTKGDILRRLRELLGPQSAESAFNPSPRLEIPAFVELEGARTAILESDPSVVSRLVAALATWRASLAQAFGNWQSYLRLRRQFEDEGGDLGEFDETFLRAQCALRWHLIDEALSSPRRQQAHEEAAGQGCGSAILCVVIAVAAIWLMLGSL